LVVQNVGRFFLTPVEQQFQKKDEAISVNWRKIFSVEKDSPPVAGRIFRAA
jgi:hypothetical protein